MRHLLLLATAPICLAACVPRAEQVTMEPLVLTVGSGGAATVSSADPELDAIVQQQESGDCADAAPRLRRFLEDYAESSRFPEAVYRLGLCEEAAQRFDVARGYFRWVAAKDGGDLGLEAALRAAWTLEELGRPADAAESYERLARLDRLPADARAGARLRLAVCLFHASHAKQAERELSRGMDVYATLPSPADAVRSAASEARFDLGEARAARFRAIALEYPQRRLAKRMRAKLAALASARDAYLAVPPLKDAFWAAAAVCRTGELFEETWREIGAVPPPRELSPEARDLYRRKVELQTRPLEQQAFDAYEQVISLGERVGIGGDWVARATQRAALLEPDLKSDVVEPAPEPPLRPDD